MKKIVFADIPLKEIGEPLCYKGTGNASSNYSGSVIFPINAVLAENLQKGDEVKVVLLKTKGGEQKSGENVGKFQSELDDINKNIGAKISYHTIDTEFNESKANHEERLRAMIKEIDENCEIFADITFGPKPLPMILMCALNFAEIFLNADIKKIVYGKVEFEKGKIKEGSQALFDVTSLYYLNGLVNSMEAKNGEEAIKALDKFFAL